MRLTRRQRALFGEAEAIASLANFDFHLIEDKDIDATLGLQIAIHKMVTGEIVIRYTLLDEILADLIARYFFQSADFPKLWRTKKFSTFVHHVLDEMYLLKKMDVVHAIKPLPSNVIKAIRKSTRFATRSRTACFPKIEKSTARTKRCSTVTTIFALTRV